MTELQKGSLDIRGDIRAAMATTLRDNEDLMKKMSKDMTEHAKSIMDNAVRMQLKYGELSKEERKKLWDVISGTIEDEPSRKRPLPSHDDESEPKAKRVKVPDVKTFKQDVLLLTVRDFENHELDEVQVYEMKAIAEKDLAFIKSLSGSSVTLMDNETKSKYRAFWRMHTLPLATLSVYHAIDCHGKSISVTIFDDKTSISDGEDA